MRYTLKIKRDGTMEFLGNPPPSFPVHDAQRSRFSEIVPVRMNLRILFRILRFLFGEEGKVSNWTRRWPCLWLCTILLGPRRGTKKGGTNRDALVNWERNIWKNRQRHASQ